MNRPPLRAIVLALLRRPPTFLWFVLNAATVFLLAVTSHDNRWRALLAAAVDFACIAGWYVYGVRLGQARERAACEREHDFDDDDVDLDFSDVGQVLRWLGELEPHELSVVGAALASLHAMRILQRHGLEARCTRPPLDARCGVVWPQRFYPRELGGGVVTLNTRARLDDDSRVVTMSARELGAPDAAGGALVEASPLACGLTAGSPCGGSGDRRWATTSLPQIDTLVKPDT